MARADADDITLPGWGSAANLRVYGFSAAAIRKEAGDALGVHSEIGRLRKVIRALLAVTGSGHGEAFADVRDHVLIRVLTQGLWRTVDTRTSTYDFLSNGPRETAISRR
jgi:hypothetical protein